jgi:hypothetical protein
VEHRRGKNGFDGMADGVSKVDEIPEPGFSLVDSDNVGLDVDGTGHDL